MKRICPAVISLLIIVIVFLIVKLSEKNDEIVGMNSMVRAAKSLNDGDVEEAVDDVDILEHWFGKRFTDECVLLTKQIRAKYSLFLLDRALQRYKKGDLVHAKNDLEVAYIYAKWSGTTLPEIAARLKEQLP